jgi:hypothetical protein
VSVWDLIDYVTIGVLLVWMFWLFKTIGRTLLNRGYPLQRSVKAAVPVIFVGWALLAVAGLLTVIQPAS